MIYVGLFYGMKFRLRKLGGSWSVYLTATRDIIARRTVRDGVGEQGSSAAYECEVEAESQQYHNNFRLCAEC